MNTLTQGDTNVNRRAPIDPIFVEIGKTIKNARLALGVSVTKLAELAGVSKQQVSNWENGQRAITLQSVLKLQPVLNISVSSLLCMKPLISEYSDIPSLNKNLDISAQQFVYTVEDDSMGATYRKGDTIIFKKQEIPTDGDLVLICVYKTNQILFRRYQIDNSNLSNPKIKFISDKKGISEIYSESQSEYKLLGVCKDQHRNFS